MVWNQRCHRFLIGRILLAFCGPFDARLMVLSNGRLPLAMSNPEDKTMAFAKPSTAVNHLVRQYLRRQFPGCTESTGLLTHAITAMGMEAIPVTVLKRILIPPSSMEAT